MSALCGTMNPRKPILAQYLGPIKSILTCFRGVRNWIGSGNAENITKDEDSIFGSLQNL
jgi:hypothetical protein